MSFCVTFTNHDGADEERTDDENNVKRLKKLSFGTFYGFQTHVGCDHEVRMERMNKEEKILDD